MNRSRARRYRLRWLRYDARCFEASGGHYVPNFGVIRAITTPRGSTMPPMIGVWIDEVWRWRA